MDKTLEELADHHAGFIFGADGDSSGINADGEEYDHSFPTEIGRVSWKKQGDEYLITITSFDLSSTENRVVDFKKLSDWFYTPSSQYYEENIANAPIQ